MDNAPPSPSRPRILIADDHAIFAEALRAYIEKTYTVIGVVADGRAMVQEAIRLKPDVVLADVSMPLLNGLDAARRIRQQGRKVKFVFLTMHNDANLAAAILGELGRVGFVLKSSGGMELLKTIEEILHDRSYLTPKLRAVDWVAAKARARQFSKELTNRQCEVVRLFAEGRSLKEIATVLNLSGKTVEFHKHQIMEAFNLKSNAELILFAVKRGLVSVCPETSQHVLAS